MTTSIQQAGKTRLTDIEREQFIREGYVIVRGLLPPDAVATTRDGLLAATGMRQEDPSTWARGTTVFPDHTDLTLTCWTDAMLDCAAELAGPHLSRETVISPYREQQGLDPNMTGYIPVLNYPTPGPAEFQQPTGAHIDGMHRARLFPEFQYLVVFAYLTDVPAYGGATAVWPGSHRKLFEHWLEKGVRPGGTISDHVFDFDLGTPVPAVGSEGDVIFMHYLLVHSGSTNHADRIRIGLNSVIHPDPAHPYIPKSGPPQPEWTPMDWTLRTDNLPQPVRI